MKIRPKGSEIQSDLIAVDQKDKQSKQSGRITSTGSQDQPSDQAKISSLGSLLSQQFNPAQMQQERRDKIDAIKAQIKNGTYNPPLHEVAQSLAQEISSEILGSGSFGGE